MARLNELRALDHGAGWTDPKHRCVTGRVCRRAISTPRRRWRARTTRRSWACTRSTTSGPRRTRRIPAREGFTPRGHARWPALGDRVGWQDLDAERAIDGWIGTVYHRFPLLEYNVNRIGFAYAEGGGLDVHRARHGLARGAAEQGRARMKYAWSSWPPDGMKNVPTRVQLRPSSPTRSRTSASRLRRTSGTRATRSACRCHATVALQRGDRADPHWISTTPRSAAGKFERGEQVPCWLHTPDEPLLKRMEIADVVFVIPKAKLKANTTYPRGGRT